MDAQTIVLVIAGGGVLGIAVWLLAQLGKVLIKIAEALAAAAVVIFTVWLLIKAVVWALRQIVIRWRTSLTLVGVLAWWQCCGWTSLARAAHHPGPGIGLHCARLCPRTHQRC
jgi:DNA segregation ATPase FtsK/SpoIIIE, S-DNA-T family